MLRDRPSTYVLLRRVAGQARSGAGAPELRSLVSDSPVIVGRGPVPRRAYFYRSLLYFGRC